MRDRRILQPLTFVQLLDEAIYLIKDNFALFSLVCMIPTFISGSLAAVFIRSAGTNLIYYILSCLIQAAGVYVISRRYLGYSVGVLETYHECVSKWFSVLAIVILSSICILIGAILLVIPGLIVYVLIYLAIPVYMIEGKSGWSALTRSRELVRGRFFTILGFIILVMVVGIILTATILACIPDTFAKYRIVEQLLEQIVNSGTSLFLMVITVLLYFDIRVKKEGFDLEMLAASMESQFSDQVNEQDIKGCV